MKYIAIIDTEKMSVPQLSAFIISTDPNDNPSFYGFDKKTYNTISRYRQFMSSIGIIPYRKGEQFDPRVFEYPETFYQRLKLLFNLK